MNEVRIQIDGSSGREPGSEITGSVHWTLDEDPHSIQVRLFWYTEGKGDRDLSIIEETSVASYSRSGQSPFRFRIPAGPYSFSGKLISLMWAIEAIAEPMAVTAREEITVGPNGREARIDTEPPEAPHSRFGFRTPSS